jgi:hypothetical protein
MQQDLVDLSLSNAFSIAKLDSIRIKANANLQITTQEAVPHFNVGRFYELIVDSKDPNHSRLIVNLFSNPYWEGVEYIRNVSRNKLLRLIVEYIFIVEISQQHQSTFQQDLADAWTFITTILIANLETSNNFQRRVMPNRIHQLIVKLTPNTDSVRLLAQENILNAKGAILISEGARRVSLFQRFVSFTIYSKSFELIDVSVPNKNKICNPSQLAANAKLNETPTSQRSILLYFNGGSSRLIVEYISSSNSEGARAPSSKLIVGCGYSKISFHFCEDCRIFREGVKDSSTIDIVGNNGIIGLADCDHISLVGLLTLADCWIVGSLGDIGLIVRINGLVGRIVQNGLNGFIDLGVSFIGLGLVGFIGLGLVSIAGLIGHISLVGLGGFSGISGLVGQISLVSHIGLICHGGLISLGELGITSLVGSLALSA